MVGAGLGIGLNIQGNRSHCQTAGGCRSDQQGTAAGLCTGRSNRYLWFRCCTADAHYEVKGLPFVSVEEMAFLGKSCEKWIC